MATASESIQDAEGTIQMLLIVAGLGILAYLVYKLSPAVSDLVSGFQSGSTTAYGWWDDFLQSIGIQTQSGGMNQPSQVPGNKTVAQSVGGYDKMGASGQMWSCSGPVGSANDMCTPVTCDASGNCTATGSAVPAAQAN